MVFDSSIPLLLICTPPLSSVNTHSATDSCYIIGVVSCHTGSAPSVPNEPGEGNAYINMAVQCASELLARQSDARHHFIVHAISTQINAILTHINAILGTRIVRSP